MGRLTLVDEVPLKPERVEVVESSHLIGHEVNDHKPTISQDPPRFHRTLTDTQERHPLLDQIIVYPAHKTSKVSGTGGSGNDKVVAYARNPGNIEDNCPLRVVIVENPDGPKRESLTV